jgi:uncharacterized lipoprotein YddW (UPF0748 family)
MNRRHFVKNLGVLGLSLTAYNFLSIACKSGSTPNGWKNWVWLTPDRGADRETWKMRLELMKQNNIHGVFVQIYGSHTAWFETTRLPVEEPLLEKLVELGQEVGIEVHAWMWTMPNNNPYFIENHPDWYAVNGLGQPSHSHPAYVGYYRFMCPNNPGVIDFVSTNVRELARINGVSGVHLDYVRLPDVIIAEALQPVYNIVQDREYPEYDYCYCETCRSIFKEQSGIDPLKDLEDPSANLAWRQFRQDSVTRLVNEHLVPEAHSKNVPITAAVFPNWEAVRQEWRKWKLDAYFPMLYHNFYNAELEWIGQHLEKQIAELEIKKPVYSGLFIPSLTPEQLEQAIEISRNAGAAGVSFFAFNSLKEDHYKVIKQI